MTKNILTAAGSVLVLMVVAAALMGMRSCIAYDRRLEMQIMPACLKAGGRIERVNGWACIAPVSIDTTIVADSARVR